MWLLLPLVIGGCLGSVFLLCLGRLSPLGFVSLSEHKSHCYTKCLLVFLSGKMVVSVLPFCSLLPGIIHCFTKTALSLPFLLSHTDGKQRWDYLIFSLSRQKSATRTACTEVGWPGRMFFSIIYCSYSKKIWSCLLYAWNITDKCGLFWGDDFP